MKQLKYLDIALIAILFSVLMTGASGFYQEYRIADTICSVKLDMWGVWPHHTFYLTKLLGYLVSTKTTYDPDQETRKYSSSNSNLMSSIALLKLSQGKMTFSDYAKAELQTFIIIGSIMLVNLIVMLVVCPYTCARGCCRGKLKRLS